MAAWIKPKAAGIVISKFNLGVTRSYFIKVQNDGRIAAHRHVAPWTLLSDRAVNFGEWSHIATTYDGSTLKIYINGQPAGSQAFGSQANDDVTPVLIGALLNSGQARDFYRGQIAEVLIWDIALSAEEIATSRQANIGGLEQTSIQAVGITSQEIGEQSNLGVAAQNSETSEPSELEDLDLDKTNRFIRLAKKLNWSFADLNWVLTSIKAAEIEEDAIKKIAKIKHLQAKHNLPLDILCSFWHKMKTIKIDSNSKQAQSLFDRVFNHPFKAIMGDKFFRLQDKIEQINLNNLEGNADTNPIITRILAALRLDLDGFIDLVKVVWKEEATVSLTVEKLSELYRLSQILRLTRLTIEEYQNLLNFLDIAELSSISIDNLIKITERAEWIKQSKFKIEELDYIINDNISPSLNLGYSVSETVEKVKSIWKQAADSLLKPDDFISEEIDEQKALAIFNKLIENNYIEEVTDKYKNIFENNSDRRIALVLDSAIAIELEFVQEIIEEELDPENLQRLSEKLTLNWTEILQPASDRQSQSEELKLREIASFFSLEADLSASLLDYVLAAFPNQDGSFFSLFSKISLLSKKLELTAPQLKVIADHQEAFEINELSQLSLDNIQAIDRFKKLITAFGDSENKLIDYFASIAANNPENSSTNKLSELAGWRQEQIELLVLRSQNLENEIFNLETVAGIAKLQSCFNLSRHLGVNIAWFTKLLNLSNATITEESWELYQNAAQAVKEITKAKYDDEEWVKISEKLEGELNERKRDVLTGWIVWQNKYENLRDLSQDLLIDVETSSCASVSIIKEATLAIQTYLHRCRMGLETGVTKLDQIPEVWWQWMMNYRVWEANRKVFLYPENYLDPSLRKIKSPIYKELEEELLQSEITEEAVEKAYQNYFEKFNEIAQLKSAGGYRCTIERNSQEQDTLYLFGRTATEPYTYYYRECIDPEVDKPIWNAWEKIDLVINSKYINATYAFNKLFIFWVEIVKLKKTEQKDSSKQEVKTETETKATIKYSFQKFGKQWIQPQTLAQDIVIETYDDNAGGNLWRKVNALPIRGDSLESEKILILFGDLARTDTAYQAPDQNQGISLSIDLLQENTQVILENQPSNIRRSVILDNKLMAVPTENVLYDNYAEDLTERNSRIGLIGYWSMSEGSGNVLRDRVGQSNGTLKGNAKLETVKDFPIKVLKLDGNGDYVDLGEQSHLRFDGFKKYTMAAWIKPEAAGTIISKFDGGVRATYFISVSDNGEISSYRNVGPWSLASNTTVTFGEWSHVATTYDGSTLKIYINGNLAGSQAFTSNPPDNLSPVLIGARLNRGQPESYFPGQIAEVSIWNVALNDEQIFNASIPFIPLTKNRFHSRVSVSAIDNQPGWFTFDDGDEAFLAIPQKKIEDRLESVSLKQIDSNLAVVARGNQIKLSYKASNVPSLSERHFRFTRLSSSTIRQLSQKIFLGGLDNLLTLYSQLTPELNFNRFSPTVLAIPPNDRQLDFDGSLGIYFREIFFHIPFLIANTLNSNQRFEEAQKWYHYIFNPTIQLEDNKQGLVGYWPLNEGENSDIINDRSGNNSNGTLQGNVQWTTVNDFPGTVSREVLDFDGENDYVQIDDRSNSNSLTNAITIETWIEVNNFNRPYQAIVTKGDSSWRLQRFQNTNVLQFYITGVGGVIGGINVNDGKWHHLAAVYDGTTVKLYVDNVLDRQNNASGTIPHNNYSVLIGENDEATGRYFDGKIAEVSIWNKALSEEQINFYSLLNNASSHPKDRFWRYLPFRGNVLQKLPDILSNDSAIAAYKNNPFDPHAIARLRIGAYEKAIVMKYIDNILDWGDQLFAQDSRESIAQATLLYFLAYDLPGEEPENLGKRETPKPKTFRQIQEQHQKVLLPLLLE